MKGFFILLLVLARQSFSGEFSGGDKIAIDKGEVTGADKPTNTRPTVVKAEEVK